MMNIDFSGQTVLVTGAGRGIGRAIAAAFAGGGARVLLHYAHDRARAEATRQQLPGADHRLVQARLEDTDEVRALAEAVIADPGVPDVLVNNAGVFQPRPVDELGFGEWQEIWEHSLAVNLHGPAHLSFLLGRTMAQRGSGRIINISSRGAFRGEPEAPAYGASKAGLNALGQSLAQAFGPHGVAVTGVAPGFTETDMTRELLAGETGAAIRAQSPMNRVARPEEVASTVTWLAGPEAAFASGTIIDLNGASHLRS